jgi:CRP-like cAMP-binding protein
MPASKGNSKMPLLDWYVNIAEVVFLGSYLVRDILMLRTLSIVGGFILAPYFYYQTVPLWPALGWNTAFIIINTVWVARLLYERRPIKLSAEEQRVYETTLRLLSPQHARTLFRHGTWVTHAPGEVLQIQGETATHLMLVAEGKVAIELEGKVVDFFGESRFFGGTAYLLKDRAFTAEVTGRVVEPTRLIKWPIATLRKFARQDDTLGNAIDATLGLELSELLHQSWKHQALAKACAAAAVASAPSSA